MPTVVIIHAAEDALPARALAEKLRGVKLTPVIEQPPGEALRAAVRDAAVTLALWSPRSVLQAALIDEAASARSKSRVIHARMQNAATPSQFANEQSIDLTGWRGEEEFAGWRQLAETVTQIAGVSAPPPPAQRPQSGFFQPGVPGASGQQPAPPPQQQQQPRAPAPPPQAPPRPAAPRTVAPAPEPRPAPPPREAPPPHYSPPPESDGRGGGGKGLLIVLGVLAVVALGAGGYFFMSNMQGGQASSAAWEEVERNDASALRAFIEGNPGAHREEAVAALSALEEQTFDAAREEDTVEAFQDFLAQFPNSDHAIEARGRIAELNSLPPTDPAADPNAVIDPLTGLPVSPDAATTATDPDLLPPGAAETAPVETAPVETPAPDDGGGPAPLTPPASDEPVPLQPPSSDPQPEQPTN